jgi:hypothetical protein
VPEVSQSRQVAHGGAFDANRVVRIRKQLGKLADWRGPAAEHAVILARAIEITMNTLLKSENYGTHLIWSFGVHYGG